MEPKNAFDKQSYEEFVIAGDFSTVMAASESITLATSTVTAVDKNGDDATADVIESGTESVVGHQLRARCKGGTEDLTPYQITFKIVTSIFNKWEIDIIMNIEEQ